MNSVNKLRAALASLFLILTGCYSVDIGPGQVPCGAAAECPDGFECQVGLCYPEGFTGSYCETIVCGAHASCSEGPPPACTCDPGFVGNGTTCDCESGYELQGDTCVEVDECARGTDTCSADATCTNTPAGSFTCECLPGFDGDGMNCADHPDCPSNPCDVNATCTDSPPGSYTCACNEPSWFGDGTRCYESVGQIIWMGHDFYLRNADVDRIIGNAVLQATTLDDIRVLGFDQFADLTPGGEAFNTDAAIMARVAERGRTATITRVSDFMNIPAMLTSTDVLLVYEMENGGDAVTMGSLGAPYIQDFLTNGGIIIVMDHYSFGWQILNTAGVMRFLGNYTTYGDVPTTVRVPSSPIMLDVTVPTYTGTNGTGSYWTNDGTILATDTQGVPVVVHKNYTKPKFTGAFGATWEPLANSLEAGYSLMTDHPAHIPNIFNMYDTTGQKYSSATNAWTGLVAAGPAANPWFQMAPLGVYLYGWVSFSTALWRYNTDTDVWQNMGNFVGGGTNEYTMAAVDDSGMIYGYVNNGNVISYNTQNATFSTYATGIAAVAGTTALYETRLVFDPPTRSLYMGQYGGPQLYRFDLNTLALTQLANIPEFQLNDIFCGDRAGHIYAAGADSGFTMFQYDIATDTWTSLPDLPVDHGNNGSCVVSDEGYLYVSSGYSNAFHRLPLNR